MILRSKAETRMTTLGASFHACCFIFLLLNWSGGERGAFCHSGVQHKRVHSQRRQEHAFVGIQLPNLTRANCDDGDMPVISFGLNEHRGASGGFGDRLRGMVTTYYLAMLTNSSYAVKWTRPFNLSGFFHVPSCDAKGGGHDAAADSNPIIRDDVDKWSYFRESLFEKDRGKQHVEIHTNSFHWREVVRNPLFKERAASLGLLELSQAELFKLAVDKLLENPTALLRESFHSVLRRLSGLGGYEPNVYGPRYVGVQIRLGGGNSGAVSGWVDPTRHSLEHVGCFASEAVRLCRHMHLRSIFVTADSDQAVRVFEEAVWREHEKANGVASAAEDALATATEEEAKVTAASSTTAKTSLSLESPPLIVVQVPGIIGHTDRSDVAAEHSRAVWLKSVLDWWVLKHADALLISRSAFGETAASSSDADVALRLKLPGGSLPLAKETRSRTIGCDFEDVLLRDKDVFQRRIF